jgi:two-component system response regulator PilR (NtrC family)
MAKTILYIGDDSETRSLISQSLGVDFTVKHVEHISDALKVILSALPSLVIFDYDLKDGGGIDSYLKIRRISPRLKVMVISALNDIGLAVSAAKLGAADFLRKPLEADRLREAVIKNTFALEKARPFRPESIPGGEWLSGSSEKLSALISAVTSAAESDKDVTLFSEAGIDKGSVAFLIHSLWAPSMRKFVRLDLLSFAKESQEGLFWSALKELLEERMGNVDEDELCGTVFLTGIDRVSEHFRLSILDFLRHRRSGQALMKIDSSIRVILSFEDPLCFADLQAKGNLESFLKINLPPLRERASDIPLLLDRYIKKFSVLHNKSAEGVSLDVLKFLVYYDWPGNYREFEATIELSVLNSSGNMIFEVPFDLEMLNSRLLKELKAENGVSLSALRDSLEKILYKAVLESSNFDEAKAAAFLDVPKTAFSKRAADLGLSYKR